jgi:DNA polymerase I
MLVHPKIESAYQLLHEGVLALSNAEEAGIRIDMDYVRREYAKLTLRISELEKQFKDTKLYKHWEHASNGKVNINSDAQLRWFLYDIKRLSPPKYTESGLGSTDEETLLKLEIPELLNLIEMKKLKKTRDYLDGFAREQVDGYIHPNFNLHLVKTYRSSANNPNLQNIPNRDEEQMTICRGALYPRTGHQFLEVDFKAIEVAVSCCYHKDSNMLKYVKNKSTDMHSDMAKQIFMIDEIDKSKPDHVILRQAAKNGFVFPQFYGDYYIDCANVIFGWIKLPSGKWTVHQGIELDTKMFTISDHLISKGISSSKAFESHLKDVEDDFWNNRFSEYNDWKKRWWRVYQKYGYIDLLTGFRCSGIMDMKNCINYPIQGTAFHCLLWSFIETDKWLRAEGYKSRLVGQIHDSMILDVLPDELEIVKETIKKITCEMLPDNWKWIIVPLEVDMKVYPVDGSWAEK